MTNLQITNSLSHKKEVFKPLKNNFVKFYQCGPTVYWTQHIGNMRAVVTADFIIRSLKYHGYDINFIRNYTDVGHLTSDEDEGLDKIEKSAQREGLSPQKIAQKYIDIYEKDISELNVILPNHTPKASDHIKEIIEMVQTLLNKGFAYSTDLAIYFDISKFQDYTKLSGQKIDEQIVGAGVGEAQDKNKINPADFALWFFRAGAHRNALQYWKSSFTSLLVENGEGFPGWHIECSAMSKKYLGNTFDIHMGGIEHIPVHHTNEIAQSESANGMKFVNYWLHHGHLTVDGGKMSKSEGTGYSLAEVKERGFSPMALRYFFTQANYRSSQNFTWEALESAQKGLENLYNQVAHLMRESRSPSSKMKEVEPPSFKDKFLEKINDDFNIPQALAVAQELLKSNLPKEEKLATILDFDKVFGFKLESAEEELKKISKEISIDELPLDIQDLIKIREEARNNKDWKKSDEIRAILFEKGYEIKDTEKGTGVSYRNWKILF